MDPHIRKLFTKYIHNRCTLDELQQVYAYLEQGKHLQEWDAALEKDKEQLLKVDLKSDVDEMNLQRLQQRIQQQFLEQQQGAYHRNGWIFMRKIAASAAILLLGFLAYRHLPSPPQPTKTAVRVNPPIVPGGNKAILRLADGKELILNEAALGKLSESNGITASKTADGLLTFRVDGHQAATTNDTEYHTLSTPRGGQYQVVLPDGSHVWLNAQSSLRFPADFSAEKREVSLSGEAYFAVAQLKNAVPFSITTDKEKVQVLGTEFNVMAYPDEALSQVYLVNGAVAVANDLQSKQLKPGQVATINDAKQPITVRADDPANYIAWKQGLFSFHKEHIYSLMKKIGRWYNVEVNYQGDMEGKVFSGTFSRFADVQDALDILQATGTIKLTLNGRRIMVRP